MKKTLLLFAVLFSATVCAQTAVKVNGQTIGAWEQKQLVQQLIDQGAKDTPDLKKYVRDLLVREKIIEQEAKKQKIEKDKTLVRALQEQKIQTYVLALGKKYQEEHPVSNAELERAYEEYKENYDPNEIKIRHILLNTESDAKRVLSQLSKGEDFAKLAKTESIDQGSSANGGLVPFTNVKQIADFNLAQVALSLEKGKVFPVPIKSRFGYHVIKLEDKRQVPLREFDEMKSQMRKQLSQNKTNAYLADLYRSAKVEEADRKDKTK